MGVEAALAHPDRIGKTSRSRDPRALRRWRDVPTREGWPAYHGSRRSAARGCSDPLSVLMLDNLAVNVRILPHRTTGRAIDKEWRACEHILGPQTRHRASPRQVSGPVLGPAGREVRRSSRPVQRAHRPQARSDRPLPDERTTSSQRSALARRAGLEVSIRGGGHNVAGRAVTDGGVMIDLAADEGDRDRSRPGNRDGRGRRDLGGAERRRRRARPGRDRRRGLRDRYRRLHARRRPRLADGQATGSPPTTCSRSSSSRRRAMCSMSTPPRTPISSGRFAEAGATSAVATSFTYRLHPVETIVGGLIAHPIEAAPDMLRFYRDAVADASDDLTVFAGLVHAPDGSGAKLVGAGRLPHRRSRMRRSATSSRSRPGARRWWSRSARCRTR